MEIRTESLLKIGRIETGNVNLLYDYFFNHLHGDPITVKLADSTEMVFRKGGHGEHFIHITTNMIPSDESDRFYPTSGNIWIFKRETSVYWVENIHQISTRYERKSLSPIIDFIIGFIVKDICHERQAHQFIQLTTINRASFRPEYEIKTAAQAKKVLDNELEANAITMMFDLEAPYDLNEHLELNILVSIKSKY